MSRTSPTKLPEFATRLLQWFDVHGRRDLPWQHPREPYRVWISEIMLQQTQVQTVVPYFERFMQRFPDVQTLGSAPLDDVIRLWAGLGYYARARNLHRAAQVILEQHHGVFPSTADTLQALPGIGRSTAGAILSQAYGQRAAVLDGNVKRWMARHAAIEGWSGQPRVLAQLWAEAEKRLPHARLADYAQASMDLGNVVCRARHPGCALCPVAEDCGARLQGRVAQIPAAKPTRLRPQRFAQALILMRPDGTVWLERRPPAGLWGGLWALPMSATDETWEDYAQRMGADTTSVRRSLPPLRHAFTHFELTLHAYCLRAKQAASQSCISETETGTWIKLDHPAAWPGVPAPIRRLLQQLGEQSARHEPDSTGSDSCPDLFTASNLAAKPKPSNVRPTPARSASASSKTSRRKPGSNGSSTRPD